MLYKLSDFKIKEKLGQGTYGIVFKVRNIITREYAAIKEFLTLEDDDGIQSTSLREVSALRELQNPYIICLKQTIIEHGKLWLIFEYLDTDLRKYMNSLPGSMDRDLAKSFSYQMMQGLLYCHSRRIIHRDLKPENLLIDKQKFVLKIGDFGMARTFSIPVRKWTHEVVTLWYRAPELILTNSRYSCAIDVWSVGCIIAEMYLNKPIFRGDSEIDQLFAIFQVKGTPDNTVWPEITDSDGWKTEFPVWDNSLRKHLKDTLNETIIDLLEKMLTYLPSKRPSIYESLFHEYFADFDSSALPFADLEKRLCPKAVYQSLLHSSK